MADAKPGEFGKLIKQWRKDKGMTLDQVAKKVDSHKGYISGVENGKVNPPALGLILKLAKVFGKDEKALATLAYIDKAPALIRDNFVSVRPTF